MNAANEIWALNTIAFMSGFFGQNSFLFRFSAAEIIVNKLW